MSVATYRIIDEIEPVKPNSWALPPAVSLLAAMFLPTWTVGVAGAGNSWLLGHPRRRQHALVCAAGVALVYAIIHFVLPWFPRPTWKYVGLSIAAIELTLAYYLASEQGWAVDYFEQSGGRIVSVGRTFTIIFVLSHVLLTAEWRGW
jgi:hypothetical protein